MRGQRKEGGAAARRQKHKAQASQHHALDAGGSVVNVPGPRAAAPPVAPTPLFGPGSVVAGQGEFFGGQELPPEWERHRQAAAAEDGQLLDRLAQRHGRPPRGRP